MPLSLRTYTNIPTHPPSTILVIVCNPLLHTPRNPFGLINRKEGLLSPHLLRTVR